MEGTWNNREKSWEKDIILEKAAKELSNLFKGCLWGILFVVVCMGVCIHECSHTLT